MKLVQSLLFLVIISTSGIAQSKFKFEVRASQNTTYNAGKLTEGGRGFQYFKVLKEGDPTHISYSGGLLYMINENNIIKLHVGKHRNGRIIDLRINSDDFSSSIIQNNDSPYEYIQFTPSYAYSFTKGRFSMPLEIGVSLNKNTNWVEFVYQRVREYNYDVRLSCGINFQLDEKVGIGGHLVFSHSLNDYFFLDYFKDSFRPYQLGGELSVVYSFSNEIVELRKLLMSFCKKH